MTASTPKPALATSLSARVLAATFGLNDYHETKRAALTAQEAFLREVAELAGLTFSYSRHQDDGFVLRGGDFSLSDFLTGSTDPKFLALDLTPKFAELIGGAARPDQRKPADVRLTPGMSSGKAAAHLATCLPAIRAYAQALREINRGRQALLDQTRADAARLLATMPGTGKHGNQRARYYARTPGDDSQPTRDLVFYPENGASNATYVQVWNGAQMQLNGVPLALAEQILHLLDAYQAPTA